MNKERFNEIVKTFQNSKDSTNQPLNMHSLLINQKDCCYLHNFQDQNKPSDIRSISKTVLTLVLGIVIKQSQLRKLPNINEHSYIYPILKKVITIRDAANQAMFEKVQIKHLLSHTIGYDDVLLMRDDIAGKDSFSYLDYLVNYPIIHNPGEHYLYSNAGFYLLSVLLQEFLQQDLLDFIKRELFVPLQVTNFDWEKYGNYLAGATRLWLYPEDLLKIGILLMQNGNYKDCQIITPQWIAFMKTVTTLTPEVDTPGAVFRRYAYGYGIWLSDSSIFFGHGTDGQTLVILPEQEAIILTLASQNDVARLEEIINSVIITDFI